MLLKKLQRSPDDFIDDDIEESGGRTCMNSLYQRLASADFDSSPTEFMRIGEGRGLGYGYMNGDGEIVPIYKDYIRTDVDDFVVWYMTQEMTS